MYKFNRISLPFGAYRIEDQINKLRMLRVFWILLSMDLDGEGDNCRGYTMLRLLNMSRAQIDFLARIAEAQTYAKRSFDAHLVPMFA